MGSLLQRAPALFTGQARQLVDRIIKPTPPLRGVAAFALEEPHESGNQFIVRGLRDKARIVGARNPGIQPAVGGRIATPARAQRRVTRTETCLLYTSDAADE